MRSRASTRSGIDDSLPDGIAARDRNGRLVGGLRGSTGLGRMHLAAVWLDESHRGRGLGSDLLCRAEAIARERRCRGICLTSFSFQAPEFCLGRGYVEFGRLDDDPPGESLFVLRKSLS